MHKAHQGLHLSAFHYFSGLLWSATLFLNLIETCLQVICCHPSISILNSENF